MTRVPDFYMSSSESLNLRDVRRCWRIRRIASDSRDDLLLTKIQPAIRSSTYDLASDLDTVILASHLQGESLFPIGTFPDRPLPVYVAHSLIEDLAERSFIGDSELELLAWAELYPSEAEAKLGLTIHEITLLNARSARELQVQPQFVAEYIGEERLKDKLAEFFKSSRSVSRSYLVRALYQKDFPCVALALRAPCDPSRETIRRIVDVISTSSTICDRLKVLFLLNDQQEREVRALSAIF
jgi:hypothetical protein